MSLLTSLVSYWKMDEASGNALDANGSNDLTDVNGVGADTGKINGGRRPAQSGSKYFTHADSASFSPGNTDFTFGIWVNGDTLAFFDGVLFKSDSATNVEYGLFYNQVSSRMVWFVSSDGINAVTVSADNAGALSTGTWYYVIAWHDSVNDVIGIRIQGGGVSDTANTASHSAGVFDGTADFTVGGSATSARWVGVLDELGYWSRVLTTGDGTSLFNSNSGLPYSSFGGGGASRGLFLPPLLSGLGSGGSFFGDRL